MQRIYFGYALADSMFQEIGDCCIERRQLKDGDEAANEIRRRVNDGGELIVCLNPSHKTTIQVMAARFPGLAELITIPENPIRVSLSVGDMVVVMGLQGRPRLQDRHEYTQTEINSSDFVFSLYLVRELTT